MYKLKQIPEDFQVEENISYELMENGNYYVFLMIKKNYTTINAIKKVALSLGLNPKNIGYAGLKDRKAVTLQYISVINKKKLQSKYDFDGVSLELKGYRDERLYPGCLDGNSFEIVVRNIDKAPKEIKRMINYFGEQRFSKNNAEIGRLIVKKKLRDAAELIAENETSFSFDGDDNDYIRQIKAIDKRILVLYLQAYQSFIWNKSVESYINSVNSNGFSDAGADIEMPLVGFGYEADSTVKEHVEKVMKEECISERDFILRQMPELSLEGGKRKIFVEVNDLEIGKLEDDEFNLGMKKCKVCFSLVKGSYATECIKQIFD